MAARPFAKAYYLEAPYVRLPGKSGRFAMKAPVSLRAITTSKSMLLHVGLAMITVFRCGIRGRHLRRLGNQTLYCSWSTIRITTM